MEFSCFYYSRQWHDLFSWVLCFAKIKSLAYAPKCFWRKARWFDWEIKNIPGQTKNTWLVMFHVVRAVARCDRLGAFVRKYADGNSKLQSSWSFEHIFETNRAIILMKRSTFPAEVIRHPLDIEGFTSINLFVSRSNSSLNSVPRLVHMTFLEPCRKKISCAKKFPAFKASFLLTALLWQIQKSHTQRSECAYGLLSQWPTDQHFQRTML